MDPIDETKTATELPNAKPAGREESGGIHGAPVLGSGPLPLIEVPAEYYALEGEAGRGGIGVVLRARDRRTDRVVALKQLQSMSSAARARFEREMRITAKLQHPGIVPVHETGKFASGEPFYAMKLVEGRSLKEVIAEKKALEERLTLLPHVLAVAETIAYAHSQRIIHRDLKPSNVIVGAFGETVVIDWGLAKDLNDPAAVDNDVGSPYRSDAGPDLSFTGQVIGTPAYMPPEQARGVDVDERADVYALGAMLYHVLVGEPPYRGNTSAEVLELLSSQSPDPIARRAPRAPRDLAAIAQKAMQRDPALRYVTVAHLVDDLRRFQTGQLVGAHHYANSALLARWAGRHRALISAAALSVLALLTLAWLSYQRINRERDNALWQRDRAETALALAQDRAGTLVISQARASLSTDPTETIEWLKTYEGHDWDAVRTTAAEAVAQGVAVRVVNTLPNTGMYVRFVDDGRSYVLVDQAGSILEGSVASGSPRVIASGSESTFDVSGDGGRVLFASSQRLMLLERATKQVVFLGLHPTKILNMALDPKGVWAASASADSTIHVWPTDGTASTLIVLRGHTGPVHWLAAAPDGKQLASTSLDGTVRLWDVVGHGSKVLGRCNTESRITFSKDGRYLVWSDPKGSIQLWDTISTKLTSLPGTSTLAGPFAFSMDSKRLAAASADFQVATWELPSFKESYRSRAASRIYALRFSPDGRTFAWADERAVRVVDLLTRQESRLQGGGFTADLDISNHTIISVGGSRNLRIWKLPDSRYQVLHKHLALASRLALSGDGRLVASSGTDQTIRVTPIEGGGILTLEGSSDFIGSLAFNERSDELLAASWDGNAYLWHLPSGNRQVLQGHHSAVHGAAFSEVGEPITTDEQGQIILWDRDAHIIRRIVGHTSRVWPLMTLDGGKLITADDGGNVRLWNVRDGTGELLGKHDSGITSLAVSSRGLVAVGGGDKRRISAFSLSHASTPRDIGPPRARRVRLSFSPHGRYLAASAGDDLLLVHDLESGSTQSFYLEAGFTAVSFAGAREVLVAATGHGMLLAWDLSSGRQQLTVVDPNGAPVQDLVTTENGLHAIFALADGSVGNCNISLDASIPVGKDAIKSWLATATSRVQADSIPDTGPGHDAGVGDDARVSSGVAAQDGGCNCQVGMAAKTTSAWRRLLLLLAFALAWRCRGRDGH